MKLPELLEVIDYNGNQHQVVQIQDVSEANWGEPEYLFQLMNLDGEVFPVSETELINDRQKGKTL